MPPADEPTSLSKSTTDTTALALLGAMLIALAVGGGASLLSVGGWRALENVVHTLGLGRTEAIAAEQERQLASLTVLERRLQSVSSDLAHVTANLKLVDNQDLATTNRFAGS